MEFGFKCELVDDYDHRLTFICLNVQCAIISEHDCWHGPDVHTLLATLLGRVTFHEHPISIKRPLFQKPPAVHTFIFVLGLCCNVWTDGQTDELVVDRFHTLVSGSVLLKLISCSPFVATGPARPGRLLETSPLPNETTG